ncbi:hypothetical protein JCGZ_22882 [Jatropha curcas]|uniref:Peroxidase n=1 Tax=Jatropha curcas TaxID=180498 RepID=A0A067JPP8_JATCU|nr:hypothetical protein JCGZ_22882 [Jatropha curcas]
MAMQKLLWLLLLLFLDPTKAWGLQNRFYRRSCPGLEVIVHRIVAKYISRDPTLAAPLLRMHFHDCFVRGCDGSILLSSTKNNQAEKEAIPNQTLRGFQIGGPFWDVPTGRRDGTVSVSTEALTQLPSPFANITQLKQNFAAKGLSVKDLVVLSGGHTIGIGHCFIISNRLYNFTGKGDTDPSLDPKYAAQLKKKCKPGNTKTIVEMDPGSFKTFDEDYYTIVSKRRGLFQSDAALLDDFETRAYVKLQSLTHGLFFARDFSESMMKLGQIGVLTGKRGEIRKRCAFVN